MHAVHFIQETRPRSSAKEQDSKGMQWRRMGGGLDEGPITRTIPIPGADPEGVV